MAVRYGFYNSINHDRKYDALDMSSIFDGIIEDGVFATIGNIFAVTPGEGLQVIVDTGKAWFDHTWTSNDAKIPLNIESADISLDRYDVVVLEVNNTESVRANAIKIVKGTISSSPQKPELINTDLVHQYPLAYVFVGHGSTAIQSQNIEFVVGKEPCPFVRGPLETVPIDALFAQWEGEFDNWFENVKTNLEGDVAANLQRQVDVINEKVDDQWGRIVTEDVRVVLDLPDDADPSDALLALAAGPGEYGYLLQIKFWDGTPAQGVNVYDTDNPSSSLGSSDTKGYVYIKSTKSQIVLRIESPWIDIAVNERLELNSVGVMTKHSEILSKRQNPTVETSGEYTLSPKVETYELCAVGAGGGGHKGDNGYGNPGGGGGGGYATNVFGIERSEHPSITVQVGAGTTGKGGTTIVTGSSATELCRANGGSKGGAPQSGKPAPGGVGNGNGGEGSSFNRGYELLRLNGNPGTVYKFNDETCGLTGGGGGGGYVADDDTSETKYIPKGGSPNGANGGYNTGYNTGTSANATTAGIGGGGGGSYQDWGQKPSNGGPGGVYLRCRYMDGSVTEWTI